MKQAPSVSVFVFAVLMLLMATLACNPPGAGSPVGLGTVTPYRAPGGEATEPPTAEPTVPPTVAAGETPSGGGEPQPNLVITSVILSTNAPDAGGWVTVQVTVENQGEAAAEGFALVLIPHYGWGPPNPAGYEDLPGLAPGATYATTFTPGVLYSDVGTFTLRVLVTDDWYALGNPDSTGSGGDIRDETITVGGG